MLLPSDSSFNSVSSETRHNKIGLLIVLNFPGPSSPYPCFSSCPETQPPFHSEFPVLFQPPGVWVKDLETPKARSPFPDHSSLLGLMGLGFPARQSSPSPAGRRRRRAQKRAQRFSGAPASRWSGGERRAVSDTSGNLCSSLRARRSRCFASGRAARREEPFFPCCCQPSGGEGGSQQRRLRCDFNSISRVTTMMEPSRNSH